MDLQATLNEFVNAVSSGDYTYFVSQTAAKQLEKKTEDNIPYGLFDILMPVFVRVFDGQKRFIYESYENKDYKDEVLTFDYDDFEYDIDETENVLVAAGAGSGKTRTLAEKVFTIIDKGEVKPSELLVLTFTDNAAHEMRERIIQTFKDRGQEDIAEQVASAHIRTFDSFARYLVSSYADVLGISSNVNLANSDVISAKKSVYLDDIFDEYYNDENKYQRLVKTLAKFNIAGERVFLSK